MADYKLRENVYVGYEQDLEEEIEITSKTPVKMPNVWGKANKASCLHKELQATESN